MADHNYSLIITGLSGPQFVQNVLHYRFDDSGFLTTKSAAAALQAAWDVANRLTWRQILPTDYTIKSYKGSRVDGGGGFEAFSPITAGGTAGTRAGTQSATGLNPVIVVAPFLETAPGRGKIFLPGISETDIEDGKYTEAYKTAVAGALVNLLDDLTLTGGGGPTASYGWIKKNGTFVAGGKVWLSMNLGTQRRRMRPV
jgi:hypothetical protein